MTRYVTNISIVTKDMEKNSVQPVYVVETRTPTLEPIKQPRRNHPVPQDGGYGWFVVAGKRNNSIIK